MPYGTPNNMLLLHYATHWSVHKWHHRSDFFPGAFVRDHNFVIIRVLVVMVMLMPLVAMVTPVPWSCRGATPTAWRR